MAWATGDGSVPSSVKPAGAPTAGWAIIRGPVPRCGQVAAGRAAGRCAGPSPGGGRSPAGPLHRRAAGGPGRGAAGCARRTSRRGQAAGTFRLRQGRGIVLGGGRGRRLGQAGAVGGGALLHGLGEVLPQVEPVGHLDRVRCPGPGSVRVRSGAVPVDHLDPGMGGQPVGNVIPPGPPARPRCSPASRPAAASCARSAWSGRRPARRTSCAGSPGRAEEPPVSRAVTTSGTALPTHRQAPSVYVTHGAALLKGLLARGLPDIRLISGLVFYRRVQGEGDRDGFADRGTPPREAAVRVEADRLPRRSDELYPAKAQ